MTSVKFKLNRKAWEKLTAFVCSYSDLDWDYSPVYVKTQLGDIHYEAARIITGDTKLCSDDTILSDLGSDTLQERRTKRKFAIFNKMKNNLKW